MEGRNAQHGVRIANHQYIALTVIIPRTANDDALFNLRTSGSGGRKKK